MKSGNGMGRVLSFVVLATLAGVSSPSSRLCCVAADEGMFPISEIQQLDLGAKGLEMDPDDIFNTDRVCLVDGICRVGGCTGSFVSENGLIITNHHCAYRAIQNASTAENDFLKNGFQAKQSGDEIPATGYTVRITESFRDVSGEVLSVVDDKMDFGERTRAIEKRRKELEKIEEQKNPGARAEVAEMFIGKSYVLFLYTYIKDVRLVFAPPASVGNFGGDVDNWEWPRHTGDFSFMRAYVAPDGSSADYAPENVPYRPKRFIKVAPQGVQEGDFVMLLGYPARTARHKTADFLRYEQDIRLPYVVDLYNWQIETLEEAGRDDRRVALKHTSRIQGLANTEKRSRGQLKGLRRANIVAKRSEDEAALQSFINADPQRRAKYGSLLSEIGNVYAEMTDEAGYEYGLQQFRSACRMFAVAFTIYDSAVERQKEDLEREAPYMDRNFDQTVKRLMLGHQNMHVPTDKVVLNGMLGRLATVDRIRNLESLSDLLTAGDVTGSIDSMYSSTKLADAEFVKTSLQQTPEELAASDDAFIQLAVAIYPSYLQLREKNKQREGRLGQLYGELIEAKKQFMQTQFVPDANATLRLTYGQIEGYSPEDAVYKSPITTLGGVVDKTTGEEPFVTPEKILELYDKRDFGQFRNDKLDDVPVAILYSTDTTGGNSGSPVLNARGDLVGVNFDRAFEATINDFAWNKSYSRSIGVDIRYVLWITGKVYGAEHLLREMGVN